MGNVLIIDGHNLLYKGYYGVPTSATLPNGQQVNAIYGYFAILRRLVAQIQPTYLITVFDTETGISSKLQTNSDYKQNRTYTDESIFQQLAIIQKILEKQDLLTIQSDKYEADDIIGTLAQNLQNHHQIVIASTDKDFHQLLTQNISIARSFHSKVTKINHNSFYTEYKFSPKSYIDFLALKGDPSDNIKGIDGIGHKRAKSLIQQHKNIEKIFDNLATLPSHLQNKLHNKRDFLLETRDFLQIDTACQIDEIDIERFRFSAKQIPDRMGEYVRRFV